MISSISLDSFLTPRSTRTLSSSMIFLLDLNQENLKPMMMRNSYMMKKMRSLKCTSFKKEQ